MVAWLVWKSEETTHREGPSEEEEEGMRRARRRPEGEGWRERKGPLERRWEKAKRRW